MKWSRPHYREEPAGILQALNPTQATRITQLKLAYPVAFENQLRESLAMGNYLYLDLLNRARHAFQWVPRPGATLVDVGSQNFYYAHALHVFF